ncbi:polysaccharide export protein [Omnitrophica bacterium]|nr:polysaccharide export protein [Candidatus Omnitrophota bacterium]
MKKKRKQYFVSVSIALAVGFFTLQPLVLADLNDLLSDPSSVRGDAPNDLPDENRQIRSGDRIKITIYPEDDYLKTGEMQVSPDGNIALPLIGKFHIEGKTVLEASKELVEIIDRDYLVDPEVVIEVTSVRTETISVSVLGSVKKPGNFEMVTKGEKFTLLQAILQAGGFSDVANIKKIKIIRKDGDRNQVIHVNAEDIIAGNQTDVQLESEDIIHVSESLF